MNERTNTTAQPDKQHESTYALLIRSEEKSRNLLEVIIYPLLCLGPLIAIWQLAQQPINVPPPGFKGVPSPAVVAQAQDTVVGGKWLPGDRDLEIKI